MLQALTGDVRDIAEAVKDAVKDIVVQKFTEMLKTGDDVRRARARKRPGRRWKTPARTSRSGSRSIPIVRILIGIGVGLALGFVLRGK